MMKASLGLELGVIATAAIVWKAIYTACDFTYRRRCKISGEEADARWAVYALSFCHAVAATVAGAISVALTPSWNEMCNADAVWRDVFILSSCGYFVQDFFMEIALPRKDWGMIFHHIFVSLFLFLAVHHHLVTHALAVLLLNEASTPFLCIRWDLNRIKRSVGRTDFQDRCYFWNGCAFVTSFGIFRVLLIPAIWFQTYWAGCLSPDSSQDTLSRAMVYVANANFPILWALNLYWFFLIVKGTIKALKEDVVQGTPETEVGSLSLGGQPLLSNAPKAGA